MKHEYIWPGDVRWQRGLQGVGGHVADQEEMVQAAAGSTTVVEDKRGTIEQLHK
jgi:hypothetical protein